MFYKYEIKNNGIEDILYLYMTFKYEFSNELTFNTDNELASISKKFITTNNIKYKGNKVYLIADGFIVKKIVLPDDSKYSESSIYNPDNFLVNIKLEDNSMCEITLREYLLGILFSKYSTDIHSEVLKAICILYNTFAYKMMRDSKYIDSNNTFALYVPSKDYKNSFDNYDLIKNELNSIIDEVKCIYLSYNTSYILPFIHSVNSGKTSSNINYPYLSSVKSLWDLTSNNYINSTIYTYSELNDILNININSKSKIYFSNNNNSSVRFDEKTFSIEELRNKLNLKSNNVYMIINNENIEFVCVGVGNGLGLSIYGSNKIASNGGKYYNILNYYFPKVKLYKYIKELSK